MIILEHYCGFPGNLDFGHTSGQDYYYGGTLIHSCVQGYKLDGQEVQTCLGNGSWSGVRPTCKQIKCMHNGKFEHGKMEEYKTQINIGDRLKFTCNEGYTLDGPAEIVCQVNGTFSDNQPLCQPVPCSLPPM